MVRGKLLQVSLFSISVYLDYMFFKAKIFLLLHIMYYVINSPSMLGNCHNKKK